MRRWPKNSSIGFRALRMRNSQSRSRSCIDRSRSPPELRHPGHDRQGRKLISFYEKAGVPRQRVLIKIASTWEGIRAAEQLEKQGIHCNLTLLFSFAQAVACAEAGVTLISPFVGRIYDWYRKERGGSEIPPDQIQELLRSPASTITTRNTATRRKLWGELSKRKPDHPTGRDRLAHDQPELLDQLEQTNGVLDRVLDPAKAKESKEEHLHLDEKTFRWMHNEDAMATEKLAEGIRKFNSDASRLQEYALSQVAEKVA